MACSSSIRESERYTYDYFFLDNICRLCWGENGSIELTAHSSKSTLKNATVAEKIREYLSIDVTKITHPKKVCTKCMNEIENFSEFKRFCQESHRKLHSILQNGPSELKTQPQESEYVLPGATIKITVKQEDIEDSTSDHFDDLPLACQIAESADKNKSVKIEKRSLHTSRQSKENVSQGIKKNLVFKCFGCERKFENSRDRLKHEMETCEKLKRGYKCNVCQKYLKKRRSYELHIRAHRNNKVTDIAELPENVYKCPKCSQTLQPEAVRLHMLRHYKQKEKRSFICDICGQVFKQAHYLTLHKMVHEGNKTQKCPHCDYRTIQQTALKVHIRTHTGERPYACERCPRRFATSSNLLRHRERHQGGRTYECKLCDRKFGYKASLEAHISAEHDRSKRHTCDQCASTYARFCGLKRHLLVKHNRKVHKVRRNGIQVNKSSDDAELTMAAVDNVGAENTHGGFSEYLP